MSENEIENVDFSGGIAIDEEDTKKWLPKSNTKYHFKVLTQKTFLDNIRRVVTSFRLQCESDDGDHGIYSHRVYWPKKPSMPDGSAVFDDKNQEVVAPNTWGIVQAFMRGCGVEVPTPEVGPSGKKQYKLPNPALFVGLEGDLITGARQSGDRRNGEGKWESMEIAKFVTPDGHRGNGKSGAKSSKGK